MTTTEGDRMSATVTAEQVEAVVNETLVRFGPSPEDLHRDATFEELDLDSLDLAELSQVVDERFGVRLKGDDVQRIKTVGDAVDLIAARAA
jgi:acyl carrier protein